MGVDIGINKLKSAHIGTTSVREIYVGINKVWPDVPTQLHFIANTAGSTIQLTQTGSPTAVSLETSKDGTTWTNYTIGNTITLTNAGEYVAFRNKSETVTGFSTSNSNYYKFVMTGSISAGGDMNTLICKNGGDVQLSDYCFYSTFRDCDSLTTMPELPSTILTNSCYSNMFYGCTGLSTATKLPATTLNSNCYANMFYGCTGLTAVSELPSTTLSSGCYYQMFCGCSGLITLPVNLLPATTLDENCYKSMFSRCTNLTNAPKLPATTLKASCYASMFEYCTSLISANEISAETLANYCCQYMFFNCTNLTTAPALPATTLANYCYRYMFQGCSNLTTLPKLPATTLKMYCYGNMFQSCSNIKLSTTQTGEYQTPYRIPTSGSGTLASNALTGMFARTGGTFVGNPSLNATYYTSNQVV